MSRRRREPREPREPAEAAARAWRPPTRRAFVQMLAAAAVAIQLRDRAEDPPPPLWIGHC